MQTNRREQKAEECDSQAESAEAEDENFSLYDAITAELQEFKRNMQNRKTLLQNTVFL